MSFSMDYTGTGTVC